MALIPGLPTRRSGAVLSALVLIGAGAALVAPAASAAPAQNCQQSLFSGWTDGKMTGPINTLDNFSRYPSTDGTCTGAAQYPLTVVQASSQAAALKACNTNFGSPNASALGGYYHVPYTYYWCNSIGA